jgi:hypothetical protein
MRIDSGSDVEDQTHSNTILGDRCSIGFERLLHHFDGRDPSQGTVRPGQYARGRILEARRARPDNVADLADPHKTRPFLFRGRTIRFLREFAARNRKLARASCTASFRCLDGSRVLCHTSGRSHSSYASIVPSRLTAQHRISIFQGTDPPGLARLDQRPSFLEWPPCRDRGRNFPRSERVSIDFECFALCPDRGLWDLCRLRP